MAEVQAEVVTPEVEEKPVAAEATQAPEVTATPETPTEPVAPEKTFTQKELDDILQRRLAKESRRADRLATERARAEFAEKELDRLRAPPPQAQVSGKPEPSQFKTYEDYVEALTDWKTDQKLSSIREESNTAHRASEAGRQAQALRAHLSTAAQKYDDFNEVVNDEDLPIEPPTLAFIAESKVGGEVAYYLGTHLSEAQRIASLSAAGQFRELIALEAKVLAPPKTTKAPAPIEPLSGRSATEKDMNDLSYEEFVARRKKQIAARRG